LDLSRDDALFFIEFDTDLDGLSDGGGSYQWNDGQWLIESFSTEGDIALPPPWFTQMVDAGGAAGPNEIIIEIPRIFLPDVRGVVNWRAAWSSERLGVQHNFPKSGYSQMDRTRVSLSIIPAEAFDLPGERLIVRPGESLNITGEAVASSTYTGVPEFWGRLWNTGTVRWLFLGTQPSVHDGTWDVQINVPNTVPPGDYQLDITAFCEPCQDSTSHAIPLTIMSPDLVVRIVEFAAGTITLDWTAKAGSTYDVLCSETLQEFALCASNAKPPVTVNIPTPLHKSRYFVVRENR
jgi:hypothetical protein